MLSLSDIRYRRIAVADSLARHRFDSDCVLGTQFESSQPHHALLRECANRLSQGRYVAAGDDANL
jgi:hypothetical protein